MKWNEFIEKYPDREVSEYMWVKMKDREIGDNDYLPIGWEIQLEHQCDEWVIGDIREARQFRDDLNKAIKFIEDNPIENE